MLPGGRNAGLIPVLTSVNSVPVGAFPNLLALPRRSLLYDRNWFLSLGPDVANLVVGSKAEPTLVLRDAQREYVFEEM